MSTAYITHPICLKHEMGSFHPERPDRLRSIEATLKSQSLFDKLQHFEAPLVSDKDLERVHSKSHIDFIKKSAPQSGQVSLDPDTSMNPYSLEAAYRAAGALVLATDLVLENKVKNTFCNIRPPGHHAERNRAMGFCLFNNVAIGAAHALEKHGIKKVAILDFDVHHGNGTEDIFKDEPQVMLCSSFQHPYYPYSSLGQLGINPNIIKNPLSAGSDGNNLKKVVLESWWPAIDQFEPELIFISAGFDAHEDDDMSGLRFKDEDYEWITKEIIKMAQKHSQGMVISTLEGGYDLASLGRSVARHVAVLTV